MNKRVLKDYTDFQVDRMVFANDIKDKHVNRINEPEKCNIITVKAEDAPVVVPYANSSKEMQLELDGMISSINAIDPKEQDRIVAKDDTGFLWRFEKYCKKNDLKYNEEYLENLLEEASIIIIKLKYKFNKPRPFQLAPALGRELKSAHAITANTPSFPSGHAAESKLIADVLSKVYPVHHGAFQAIAEKINYSRYIGGLHFPNDIEYGNTIGEWLAIHSNTSSY
jgi:hypothetical protein